MSRNHLNSSQFGISQREQSEMVGNALGGHIWDAVENMAGGPGSMRASVVTDAWSKAHAHFQGEDVRADADDDDYPVMHHRVGQWSGRYPVGGPYVTMHRDGQPLEALHMQPEDRHNPSAIKSRVKSWVDEDSQYY